MLTINGIDAYYGKVQALHNISMEVGESDIIAMIGSNGAGKTTTMSCIMGMVHAKNGTIEFNGENITGLKTHQIMRKGLVYVPEGREVFPNMTVLHNLEMGAYSQKIFR